MACLSVVIGGVVLAVLVVLKIYTKITTGWDKSYTCLVGKTAIVTGANTGIGYMTALEFAKRGGRVILACRDKNRAKEAMRKIIEETDNENICVRILDLSSFASVRKFAEEINATEDRLDILVNNAGAGGLAEKLTEDGLELTAQINYFSVFLLTNLLIGLMKKTGSSRIVNVSSLLARFAKLDGKNLNKFNGFVGTYSNTKLLVNLFTMELAKKLKGTGVTVYSLHPGAILTDIWRRVPKAMRQVLLFCASCSFKTIEEGAQTTIHVSLAKNIEDLSGQHFHDCHVVEPYNSVRKFVIDAPKIWTKTEELVKLSETEKRAWEI